MRKISLFVPFFLAAMPAFAADTTAAKDDGEPSGTTVVESSATIVNGKLVDPNSPEGKAMLRAIDEGLKNGEGRVMKMMVNGKEVDPNSPEGKRLSQMLGQGATTDGKSSFKSLDKHMDGLIRKELANSLAVQHAKLRAALNMTPAELAAIEPLLMRVENLRRQKNLLDSSESKMDGFAKALLGDATIEPSVQDCQDAHKALKAIMDDAQANTAEMDAAIARIRKARAAFDAVLGKAQAELKAVLTSRREALLMDRGILD